ncbi:MAG: hypothetical protein ACRELG_07370 [Gemmataceae bacterium]
MSISPVKNGKLLVVGVHQQIGQHLRLIGGVIGQNVRGQRPLDLSASGIPIHLSSTVALP